MLLLTQEISGSKNRAADRDRCVLEGSCPCRPARPRPQVREHQSQASALGTSEKVRETRMFVSETESMT